MKNYHQRDVARIVALLLIMSVVGFITVIGLGIYVIVELMR